MRMNSLRYIWQILAWCCVGISCFAAMSVTAHQQKAGVTNVFFNPRTGDLEIMHKLLLHDAEHAVKALFDKDADILNDRSTQSKFAQYVSENFSIAIDNRGTTPTTLPLTLVGHELEGQFIWVYQSTPAPPPDSVLTIQHRVLKDIWPAQNNLLNIKRAGKVNSLHFTERVSLLSIALE